jgi:hypothetical protein
VTHGPLVQKFHGWGVHLFSVSRFIRLIGRMRVSRKA